MFLGVALGLVTGVEVLHASAAGYYFTDLEFLRSAVYLQEVPIGRAAMDGMIVVAAIVAWVLLLIRIAGKPTEFARRKLALSVLGCAALVGVVDLLGGTNLLSTRDSKIQINVATAPSATLLTNIAKPVLAGSEPVRPVPSDSASKRLLLSANRTKSVGGRRMNLVIVVVESFGMLTEADKASRLVAPFEDPELRARYDVQEGTVPFRGPTVAAEYRELCGVSISLSNAIAHDVDLGAKCLPAALREQGYETYSFHGYWKKMFDRNSWYPALGFEHSRFLDDIPTELGLRKCDGALPGICDSEMPKLIEPILRSSTPEHPRLIYWLTLNSHLPVSRDSYAANRFNCDTADATETDSDLCHWMNLIMEVNESVAGLANANIPATEFLIVGDHAPPFISQSRRSKLSQTSVPYIRLIPKVIPKNRERELRARAALMDRSVRGF